jgi:hypothetical protein
VDLETILIIVFILVGIPFLVYLKTLQMRSNEQTWLKDKREDAHDLPEDSVFDKPIVFEQLESSPEEVAHMAGKVSSVNIIEKQGHYDEPLCEAYVVDANGLPVTVLVDYDYAMVFKKAKWLADQLEVPFSDET